MNRAQGQRPPIGVPALAAAHKLPANPQVPPEAAPVSPPHDAEAPPPPAPEGAVPSIPSPIEENATGSVSPTPNPNHPISPPPLAAKESLTHSQEDDEEAVDSLELPPVPPVLVATGASPLPPELADQPVPAERRNRPTSMLLAARGGTSIYAFAIDVVDNTTRLVCALIQNRLLDVMAVVFSLFLYPKWLS